jgi:glycosyltransferase involved in cell wall biosynthesis
LKILALSNLYPPDVIGGYEISNSHVVDALRHRGHDVRVLTSAPRAFAPDVPHVLRRFRLVEEGNWTSQDPWSHPLGAGLRDAASRFVNAYNVHALTTALEEDVPDVVYVCNLVGLGGLALIACLNYLKVPWVWQLGDNIPRLLCGTLKMEEGAFPALTEEFSRQVRGHYIVVSRQLAQQIKDDGVTLNGDVEVIPNWIVGARPPARGSFYRGGTLRIMSAGTVSRHKGADILVEAAARLRDSGRDDFVVDIYGKLYSHEIADAIRRHDLDALVTLKGVRTHAEIMDLYGDYDVFAFATHEREPFGLVPLEAASRGCVPLMTRRCGIAEYLVHGVHCLKAPRSAGAFADALGPILEGEIDLEPIARRAQAAILRDFHLDALLPRIERKLAVAARQPRDGGGTPAEAYRLARLAEQLSHVLIQESLCA